jgi:drug/metabolite transporter (DMT)-like permease
MESHLLGGIAALVSAAAWALGTVLWRRIGEGLSPLSINLCKSIISIVYLALALAVFGGEPLDWRTNLYLGVSGVLGIALADTFFFSCLLALGSKNASIIGTAGPVFTALAAVALLGERPPLIVWIGILLTSAGVFAVLWERGTGLSSDGPPEMRWRGLRDGFLFLFFMTVAILLAKVGLVTASPLQGTLIRMVWATAAMFLWTVVRRKARAHLAPLAQPRLLAQLLGVVTIGTFGGFWLSLVALKLADASVATILNSTTPLFVLPLAGVILKERIPLRTVVGAFVAVAGVAMILTAGG